MLQDVSGRMQAARGRWDALTFQHKIHVRAQTLNVGGTTETTATSPVHGITKQRRAVKQPVIHGRPILTAPRPEETAGNSRTSQTVLQQAAAGIHGGSGAIKKAAGSTQPIQVA